MSLARRDHGEPCDSIGHRILSVDIVLCDYQTGPMWVSVHAFDSRGCHTLLAEYEVGPFDVLADVLDQVGQDLAHWQSEQVAQHQTQREEDPAQPPGVAAAGSRTRARGRVYLGR